MTFASQARQPYTADCTVFALNTTIACGGSMALIGGSVALIGGSVALIGGTDRQRKSLSSLLIDLVVFHSLENNMPHNFQNNPSVKA